MSRVHKRSLLPVGGPLPFCSPSTLRRSKRWESRHMLRLYKSTLTWVYMEYLHFVNSRQMTFNIRLKVFWVELFWLIQLIRIIISNTSFLKVPCRSPHSNCSCNPGFLCSCSKTVLWNTIPIDIRNSSSLVTFKSKLKTFLFRRAYAS